MGGGPIEPSLENGLFHLQRLSCEYTASFALICLKELMDGMVDEQQFRLFFFLTLHWEKRRRAKTIAFHKSTSRIK